MALPKAGEPFKVDDWQWAISESDKQAAKFLMKKAGFDVASDVFNSIPEKPVPHEFISDGTVWKTKAGVRMLVTNMEDSHIANAMQMLKRQEKDLKGKLAEINKASAVLSIEKKRRVDQKAAIFAKAAHEDRQRKLAEIQAKKLKEKPTGRKFRED